MTATEIATTDVRAADVRKSMSAHMLTDGYDFILDLVNSRGARLVDERDGTELLDMFTFFASNALGMNHPGLVEDETFRGELLTAALNKPSNSDVYSVPLAEFVQTFERVLGDPELPHLFLVEGGGLAVENALKVAFDWKSRQNEAAGRDAALGTKVLHLTGAFHGRTGYTMSLTNTDPNKVARFPKFDWPRIDAPYVSTQHDVAEAEQKALAQAKAAFEANPHDIACFICEPIQGEGGDRHLRPGFLQAIKELCHANDALVVFDEVQTGCGLTGETWAYKRLGVTPDVVSFGKKLQVCGVMAGGRVDEIEDNVFRVGSRINSTWGGNLTDIVRSRRILEVIEADQLIGNARQRGEHLLAGLERLADKHESVTEPRGLGLMCAVNLPEGATRDKVVEKLLSDENVLMLGCGESSIRFRPNLAITDAELDEALDAFDRVLSSL